MSGILSWGTYLPHRRLDRSTIRALVGSGGGKGTRAVASFDEDTTTLAVAAARRALGPDQWVQSVTFSTPTPAYLEKTNATAIHAALQLGREAAAYDMNGSVRSAMAALRSGFASAHPALVVAADIRGGLPGGADESSGGDGAAALVVSGPGEGAVADFVSWCSVTAEFLDRWRIPGAPAARSWEERFGEIQYLQCGIDAWEQMLSHNSLTADQLDHVIVCGTHDRAAGALIKKLGLAPEKLIDALAATVGNLGAAAPFALLAAALERAQPGELIALVVLADGADVLLMRTTDQLASTQRPVSVAEQVAGGAPISYGRYLAWRGLLPVEPPRRPEPARPSASAAARTTDWKFGFVDPDGTAVAGQLGTIVTFTIDRLVYSQSPPVVFAIVDFDGGKRVPVELTDCDPEDVQIGGRVEMTFRKLFTSDGIHNYFWKGRLV